MEDQFFQKSDHSLENRIIFKVKKSLEIRNHYLYLSF